MLTREQLETALWRFPGGARSVNVVGGYRFVVTLLSNSFEGQDEGTRQEAVWSHLAQTFSDAEMYQIEFVFADTPAERPASVASGG